MRLEQIPEHILFGFMSNVRCPALELVKHDLTEVSTFTFEGGHKLIYVPAGKLIQISELTITQKGETDDN